MYFLSEIAQVTTAYTASGAEQLSVAPGQLILILKKNSSGWWQGELQVMYIIHYIIHLISILKISKMFLLLSTEKKEKIPVFLIIPNLNQSLLLSIFMYITQLRMVVLIQETMFVVGKMLD